MAKWLSTKEAADYLRFHRDTLRRYRRLRIGPRYSKIGRVVRYHIDDLDEWVRSQARGGDK